MAEENRRDDELINRTEGAEAEKGGGRELEAANLFDLRRIIGAILTITGLFDSKAEIDKSAGVHINLWTGLAMLVLGGLFLLWAFTRPLGEQLAEAERESNEAGPRPGGDR
jgi:xanthine/uracil/vitamin C permease (AzgA family)